MNKKHRLIITGSNGFLGQHLADYLSQREFEVFGLSRGDNQNMITSKLNYSSVDLTNNNAVKEAIETIKPDIIIHNAAMSKPDSCHNNREECMLQNVAATNYLLEASLTINPYFLYISTDFIFGEDGPHSEDDKPNPLNFYGKSKLFAEEAVKSSGLNYGIVRPVFIYGPSYGNMRPTFLHWVKNNLEQGKGIKVVSDQQRTPTYVYDICQGILSMIEKRVNGVVHLAGKDIVSPYQMAIAVAKELNLNPDLIGPVTSETFPEPVIRAKKSGLKIEKAKEQLGYDPVSFEEGIKLTFMNKSKL
jgi:dTDP-4-dehydrorhamnose reductase